jgi:hypothetical protein
MPQIGAALAAAAVARWTRGMVRTMAVGIGVAVILAKLGDLLGVVGGGL